MLMVSSHHTCNLSEFGSDVICITEPVMSVGTYIKSCSQTHSCKVWFISKKRGVSKTIGLANAFGCKGVSCRTWKIWKISWHIASLFNLGAKIKTHILYNFFQKIYFIDLCCFITLEAYCCLMTPASRRQASGRASSRWRKSIITGDGSCSFLWIISIHRRHVVINHAIFQDYRWTCYCYKILSDYNVLCIIDSPCYIEKWVVLLAKIKIIFITFTVWWSLIIAVLWSITMNWVGTCLISHPLYENTQPFRVFIMGTYHVRRTWALKMFHFNWTKEIQK